MSATAPISLTEWKRRHAVATRFVSTAVEGDVRGFLRNTLEIDWPGAWLDIFRALAAVPRSFVSDEIRAAFLVAWRGTRDLDANAGIKWSGKPSVGCDWTLTKDLDGNTDLLVCCLNILMPSIRLAEPPLVLYRGQSLREHHAGTYGVWWTTAPLFAESFARGPFRAHVGQGAVVVAVNPADAIIYKLNKTEFLLDPSKLNDVRLLDVPPRNTAAEAAMSTLERDMQSRTLGIPNADDAVSVREWIEHGMQLDGLRFYRETRLEVFAEEMAARINKVAA